VPFSEAMVFRTEKGFIIKDKEDEQWNKYIPFDDLDHLKTKIACKTLEPARINAMKTIPIPKMVELPKEILDDIETDLEKLCNKPEEDSEDSDEEQEENIQIASLHISPEDQEDQEDEEDQDSAFTLTSDDLMKHQFGTLTPYVDDYTKENYEIEENLDTHQPTLARAYSIPISNKYGPLSYQHSLLLEDTAECEDFDKNTRRKSDLTDTDDECEPPSSLYPSSYEQHLSLQESLPQQAKESPLNNIKPIEDDIPGPIEDPDIWTLIQQSLPSGLILNGALSALLLLFLAIGIVVQINMAFILTVFFILTKIGTATFNGLCVAFKTFLDKYLNIKMQKKRKPFTNTPGKTTKHVKNPSKLHLKTPHHNSTIKMNLLNGFHIKKPEGIAGSSKKTKKTYYIEPARISEARIIKTVDDRHFFKVIFFEHISRLALYDPGACCSTISRKFLKTLQAIGSVPVREESLKVEGAIRKATQQVDKIAYLDFQLETGHWIRNIPFLVVNTGNDVLIGNNLIRAHRWANCWKNSNFYIDIGNNEPLVPTYNDRLTPTKPVNAITINKITVYPTETTTIGLKIPCMGSKSLKHFKYRDLLADSIDSSLDSDLEIFPTLTRLRNNELHVVVRNKNQNNPITLHEGMDVAKVEVLRDNKPLHIIELHNAKKIYNSIPRIHSNECHCQIPSHLEEHEVAVKILVSDRLGNTSIGSVLDDDKVYTLEPGLVFIPYSKKSKSPLLLMVASDDGSLAHIDKRMIGRVVSQINNYYRGGKKKPRKTPLYYFLDPLHSIAFTSRLVINDLFKQIKFSFYPVRLMPEHSSCVRPAVYMSSPELFTNINKTKIHIQNGPYKPLETSLLREHGTPLIQLPFYDARIFMFKLGQTLNCHLHVPTFDDKGDYLTEACRNKIITSLFSELRYLRIPLNVEISVDGHSSVTGAPLTLDYLKDKTLEIVKNFPPFYEPSIFTKFPSRLALEHPVAVEITSPLCLCALCFAPDFSPKTKELVVYKGDINELICSAPYPPSTFSCYLRNRTLSSRGSSISSVASSDSSRSDKSCISRTSRVSSEVRNILASIGDVSEDFDTDLPLDYMELCDENELQTFLNTHPGTEGDDEDTSNLPPPQTSNPELFKGFDMVGIPDQFRPGDYKTTDMLDRLDGVTPEIKAKFEQLLIKHKMVFSYYASDCRPVLLHGKPAVVDISLTTDEPIFMKPYMVNGAAVDMLDAKLDELIEKNEIHPIESKYNVAIILTHHNSSQKHVEGKDKKVRLVLDMRWVNAVMKDKNLHSYLVKKIELLFMTIHGSTVMTSFDISKAYRALVASYKLQQICAFRTPSSRKYPSVTWAFRSACDGLANLPGYYSYLMQEALSKEAKQFTIAHIDDLLIFSKSDEEHIKHLDIVLTDLGKSNFMVSAKKVQPFQRKINFLGHMLDGFNKWIPDDRKSYFDTLEPPQNKKQLQSLLGVANYMGSFIDSHAMIVGPLYDALKGKTDKQPIVLNDIQMKSFLELKKQIASAPKLCLLDTTQTIYMECDASLVGTGSVLYHKRYVDGKEYRDIIRYGSRRFSLTESLNHTSLEREAMAILIGVKQHMSFLEACPEVVIVTDLKSLITLLSCFSNPDSLRMARISHRLYSLPFKWSLIHSPGLEIPITDLLSRNHKPYKSLYSDRHLRYPDLKRENIIMPPEWRNKPDLKLTTTDLLEAIRQQIVFIEKSSASVKEKRLKALIQEVSLQYEELSEQKEQLATMLEQDLVKFRDDIKQDKLAKLEKKNNKLSSITAISPRILVTPEFITKAQNKNKKLHTIITILRTMPKEMISKNILKRFRLLNDSILVTRKNMGVDFDHPGNLRIVCDADMTIHILSLIHVMSGHFGMNTLNHAFTNTYKCIDRSTQGFVKLVCNACRSCRFHRQTNKKVVPEGRIPIPSVPNDTWMIDFMVFKQEQTFKGRKVAAAFNIVDLFSNLFISIPVANQTSSTVINCLKQVFAQFNVPRKIVSDNAKALCRNPEVLHFLKINNVKQVATTTAYNSQGNKVERMHKTFRDTLKLVQETFKREKQFDMYYTVVQMMNSRPLSLSLHPHIKNICKNLNEEPGVITPFALHFGLPPVKHPQIPLENTLEPESREKFRAKWKHIITEYDTLLQKDLECRQELFKGRIIEVGDLVLLKNMVAHKEQLRYFKEIYEVVNIQKARYFCAPLFTKGQIIETNGNNLKPYAYSELLDNLPEDIRRLMGENLSPEELRKKSENNVLPEDLHSWQHWKTPTSMSLRNRLTPPDKQSEPALSILETDILSEDSEDSSLFTLTNDIPDFKSEASSFLNRSGVTQLKTTDRGIISTPFTTKKEDSPISITKKENPPITITKKENLTPSFLQKDHKQAITPSTPNYNLFQTGPLHPNITIRQRKPSALTNDLEKTAVTIEDVENSWKQRLLRNRELNKNGAKTPREDRTEEQPKKPAEEVIQNNPPEEATPPAKPEEQDEIAKTPDKTPPPKRNTIVTPDIPETKTIIPTPEQDKPKSPVPLEDATTPTQPKAPSPTITEKPTPKKPPAKETKIPEDSIKYRLRNATLKPFKFLDKAKTK